MNPLCLTVRCNGSGCSGAYYGGGAWTGEDGGGGKVVNELAFKAVAQGLREQDLLSAVRIWQVGVRCLLPVACCLLPVACT
jgi:hypothetical protein